MAGEPGYCLAMVGPDHCGAGPIHLLETDLEEIKPGPAIADQKVTGPPAAVQEHDVVPTSKVLGPSELFIFLELIVFVGNVHF